MKLSEGMKEQGVYVGNVYDKYGARNPAVRLIMHNFYSTLSDLVERINPRSIHEVGCGEGYWVLRWVEDGIAARGSDFSAQVIELARTNAISRHVAPGYFETRDIYDLDPLEDGADLVVCCEVLEHLDRPRHALQALQSIVHGHLIISVPREPLWSVLNMMRGKYLNTAGNTPGHLQRWSRHEFMSLVSGYFDIMEVRTPIPWTMLLCRPPGWLGLTRLTDHRLGHEMNIGMK
jgi:2-polyprenyl-3-methyl-5-hydroxy-6-metoxy-1,4-benzoquinol methylase